MTQGDVSLVFHFAFAVEYFLCPKKKKSSFAVPASII